MKNHTTHRERVAQLVSQDIELMQKLFEPAVDTRIAGNGPAKPPYAQGRHKQSCHLTGTNIILLMKLVKNAEAKAKEEGVTNKLSKSVLINDMIEFWMEHH